MEIVDLITGGIILILGLIGRILESTLPIQLQAHQPIAEKTLLQLVFFISHSGTVLAVSIIIMLLHYSAKMHAPLIIITIEQVKMELEHVHLVTMLVTIVQVQIQSMPVHNVKLDSKESLSTTLASVPLATLMMGLNLDVKLVQLLIPTV